MKFYLTVVLVISSGNLWSQIVTDRPDQTESSSTVGKRNFQIESGFLLGFEGNKIKPVRQILAPTTLFRFGITNGLELRLLNQFESVKVNKSYIQGISDLEIGTKIQLFRAKKSSFEMALLSHLILPVGSEGLSNEKIGTINKLSLSHEINDNMWLGYNIGYDYFGIGNGNLTYSIALGIMVNEKVGVYLEPFGEVTNFNDIVLNYDTGFTFLMHQRFQFDFSFGSGLTQRMNYISLGFSWLAVSGKSQN